MTSPCSQPTITEANCCGMFCCEFPDLCDNINEGLFHLQIGDLRRFAEGALARLDKAEALRAVRFLDRCLKEGDSFVQNAVHVSALEHIDRKSPEGSALFALLPPELQAGWHDITEYLNHL